MTYNGTRPANAASLGLPDQWSLDPYVSQVIGTSTATGVSDGRDLVVDPDTNIIYVVQVGPSPHAGSIYRYDFSGMPTSTNPSWTLNSANTSPVSIAISGNRIYVFDNANHAGSLAPYLNYVCLLYTSPSPRD